MRTDIAGLLVIALLGATLILLFTPTSVFVCRPNVVGCAGYAERFFLACTTVAAAIWIVWRVRRGGR